MHRQVNALLSNGASPGELARFGEALRRNGVNIDTIGGAEFGKRGAVTIVVADRVDAQQDDLIPVAAAMGQEGFPYLVFRTVQVKLDNTPGELGRAAAALGDINIHGILLMGKDGDKALVGLGIRPLDVDEAVSRLSAFGGERLRHPDEPDPDNWRDAWDDETDRKLGDGDGSAS